MALSKKDLVEIQDMIDSALENQARRTSEDARLLREMGARESGIVADIASGVVGGIMKRFRASTPAHLVDLSRFQNPDKIDYHALRRDGIIGAYVRISSGRQLDNAAIKHLRGLSEAGVLCGGYHAANPDEQAQDSEKESAIFINQMELIRAKGIEFSLIPAIDLERGKEEIDVGMWATEFAEYMRHHGESVGIYGRKGYLKEVDLSLFDFVWLAHYVVGGEGPLYRPDRVKSVRRPNMPLEDIDLWQWTSNGKIKGYSKRVDLNLAPHGLEKLRRTV